MPHKKDKGFNKKRAQDAGLKAFWDGRPISANPLIGKHAGYWRDGWLEGEGDYVVRLMETDRLDDSIHGMLGKSKELLDRLRPASVSATAVHAHTTRKGAGFRGKVVSTWYL